ncbi:hypothetical protein [Streptomyces eurythermus]|uniref:hypothetical protein n=1 Tax=Streptomyces eurythermus TaxID=42237 RepID=UPI0036D3F1FE
MSAGTLAAKRRRATLRTLAFMAPWLVGFAVFFVNGGVYLVTIQQFGYDYESGKATDLKAGLAKTAAQIDTDIVQARP